MELKNNYIRFITIFIIIITIFLWVALLNATTMKIITLDDLCRKSNEIIIARVTAKNSYWNEDKDRIYTDIYFKVEQNIKGRLKPLDQITMKYYGGSLDGVTTLVVGAPQFTVGEKSLLFLAEKQSDKTQQNFYVISGFSQGKFNITIDSETKKEKVEREQKNIPLPLELNSNSLFQNDLQPVFLKSFLNYVTSYIK